MIKLFAAAALAASLTSAGAAAAQAPPTASPHSPSLDDAPFADEMVTDEAVDGEIPPPPPGKGQVVFYRPSRFVGAVLSFSLHEGNSRVGKLFPGRYFVQVVEPGLHTYTMRWEFTDTLRVEVAAGETQYVQEVIGAGVIIDGPRLRPSTESEFASQSLKRARNQPVMAGGN